MSKIDIKDKAKDAVRCAKQSIAVFNPLNEFLKPFIVNAHKEYTSNQRHSLLLSEFLMNFDRLMVNGLLPNATAKAIKRLKNMFPMDETTETAIVSNLAKAIRNYRAFTATASNNAITAKIESNADFTAKLLEVSFFAFNPTAMVETTETETETAMVATA